ncbi:MAG: hypothetical protein NZL90_04775 [Aquificaceae bacterium]|nr:hypothetical protein [Aquificaceae bacterium]MDW8237725.1 hypothetical protein [Aquificaceae bacterium]
MIKSSYRLSGGRWRIHFYNPIEKERFEEKIRKEGFIEVLESGNSSLLIKVNSAVINEMLDVSKFHGLDRSDIHFYLGFFIKHPFLKALFSIGMLGFWVGLINFGVCSMIVMPYIKSRF